MWTVQRQRWRPSPAEAAAEAASTGSNDHVTRTESRPSGSAAAHAAPPAAQRQLDFGDAALVEVQRQRHHGHARSLHFASQLFDLAAMQEQTALACGRVAEAPGRSVLGDVGVQEPEFAALLGRVGLGDRRLSGPEALDLAAFEGDPGFVAFLDEVVAAGLAVDRDRQAAIPNGARHV